MIYPEILNNGNLKLTVNDAAALADEDTIEAALEVMLSNSIFNWLDPSVCGDLTDAPMLAIISARTRDIDATPGSGYVAAGFWDGKPRAHRVTHRWAWMDYAVRDLLECLKTDGYAVLQGGAV
jgi:hypothetical protein